MMGRLPILTSGFGMVSECSRRRVPNPPQNSTTFTSLTSWSGVIGALCAADRAIATNLLSAAVGGPADDRIVIAGYYTQNPPAEGDFLVLGDQDRASSPAREAPCQPLIARVWNAAQTVPR